MAPPPETTKPQDSGEMPSVFIPKESLGDREVKAGDTITLTVRDVDPDTGEVEASCDYNEPPERPGYAEAIDNMPENDES